MNYDYFKLYLKKLCGVYKDPIIYKDYNTLINDLGKFYHDYKGCMIVARDKINKCDTPICSKDFANGIEVNSNVYREVEYEELDFDYENDDFEEEFFDMEDEEQLDNSNIIPYSYTTRSKKKKIKIKKIIKDEKKIIKRLARRRFNSV